MSSGMNGPECRQTPMSVFPMCSGPLPFLLATGLIAIPWLVAKLLAMLVDNVYLIQLVKL